MELNRETNKEIRKDIRKHNRRTIIETIENRKKARKELNARLRDEMDERIIQRARIARMSTKSYIQKMTKKTMAEESNCVPRWTKKRYRRFCQKRCNLRARM